jgi:acetyl-CoA acyltransferase
MKEAVVVSAVRTAVGKAPKGTLRSTRPDDLGAVAVRGALDRVPALDAKEVEDVIIGCAMPEGEQGMNMARIISLRASLPIESAAMTINRYCASGLQSIALAAERIRGGGADVIVAGGAESMSYVPFGGNKVAVNPWLVDHYPNSYLSMGLTAERVAKHYGITREESDQFALESHQKALHAVAAGKFDDEIVPVQVTTTIANGNGKPAQKEKEFRVDEGPRADTSAEALAKLRPAFHAQGVVTAGNSSQTSDGAAAAVVMSDERAHALGPLRRVCLRRLPAGRDGYRPSLRDSKSIKDGRPHPRRH